MPSHLGGYLIAVSVSLDRFGPVQIVCLVVFEQMASFKELIGSFHLG